MTSDSPRADFDDFVIEHLAVLVGFATALVGDRSAAEDLVQTALTAVWSRWADIKADTRLSYVYRSISNARVSAWRRSGRHESPVHAVHDAAPSFAATTTGDVVELRQVLVAALRQVPPRQRTVLAMRYLCDWSDADIAVCLEISAATVRTQAVRGLARLREVLDLPSDFPVPPRTTAPSNIKEAAK